MTSDIIARLEDFTEQRRLIPLEEFGYPWHTSSGFKPAMEAMLAGRWEKAGDIVTDMQPPINFDDQPRQHACDLHSFEPAGYALRAHEVFEDRRYLDLAASYIFDWIDRYWKPVSGSAETAHLDQLIADTSTFAWYDMAVGRRIFRLAYLLDVLARDPTSEPARLQDLWQALQFHHAMLGREHFFRANSNHGIHQALGQLAAARRFFQMPESAAQFALARERLLQLLDEHFTPEGAHKEHSPGYHYGLMVSFIGAAASGLFDEKALRQRVRAMEEALSWMIMPNHVVVPLGDTDPKRMVRAIPFVSQFADEGLQHQMTGGKLGKPPSDGVKAMAASGYVFARFSGNRPDDHPHTYLAQIAAYHSSIHKHADHLSFVWYDRNREVLTDPGRFAYAGRTEKGSELLKQGFWYADPKRIYVESTRAHNCVEIDGRSYPRSGPGSTPFKSALKYASEQQGLVVTDCEVTHFRTVRHWRGLVMAPGRFLLVLDWLYDRSPLARRDFRQWFQFHPDWHVNQKDNLVRAVSTANQERSEERMIAASLLPDAQISKVYCGQQEPELQGWYSNKANSLIPSPSFHFHLSKVAMAQFATLFSWGDNVAVDTTRTRVNKTMRSGRFVWSDARGRNEVTLVRPKEGPPRVTLSTEL